MVKESFGVGETVILAKENAVKNLGVENQDVKFEVLQLPVKKVLGLFGGKMAKVRAFIEISPAKKAAKYVENVLINFGLKDFTVEILEKEDGAELQIVGQRISPIIGRRGELLDNIQYLAGLVANSIADKYYRLTINAGNYREKREKSLESLGKKIAFKALKTNKPQVLEPMTPYERRVLHLEIEKIDGVESWSEGEGIERHLVVAPTALSSKPKEN